MRAAVTDRRSVAPGSSAVAGQAFAPAKVNLFLHVGAPEASGYHPSCSLMAFADVGDRVSLHAADAFELQVVGPFARELSWGEENLVAKAARALVRAGKRPVAPVGLTLEKRLPVAAGLGGGSSDASWRRIACSRRRRAPLGSMPSSAASAWRNPAYCASASA